MDDKNLRKEITGAEVALGAAFIIGIITSPVVGAAFLHAVKLIIYSLVPTSKIKQFSQGSVGKNLFGFIEWCVSWVDEKATKYVDVLARILKVVPSFKGKSENDLKHYAITIYYTFTVGALLKIIKFVSLSRGVPLDSTAITQIRQLIVTGLHLGSHGLDFDNIEKDSNVIFSNKKIAPLIKEMIERVSNMLGIFESVEYQDFYGVQNSDVSPNFNRSMRYRDFFVLEESWITYKLTTSPKTMMYDFYVMSYLTTLPIEHGGFGQKGSFIGRDPKDIREDILHAESVIVPALRDELSKALFIAICAEIRHVVDLPQDYSAFKDGTRFSKLFKSYIRNYANLTSKVVPDEFKQKRGIEQVPMEPTNEKYGKSYQAAMKAIKQSGSTDEDFAVMCAYMFRNMKWNEKYGGENWAMIAEAYVLLNKHPQTLAQLQVAIDHAYDLEHNTGSVLNKLKRYYIDGSISWLKQALDFKANIRNINQLLPHCSQDMYKLAVEAFKKGGISIGDLKRTLPPSEARKKREEKDKAEKGTYYPSHEKGDGMSPNVHADKGSIEASKTYNVGDSFILEKSVVIDASHHPLGGYQASDTFNKHVVIVDLKTWTKSLAGYNITIYQYYVAPIGHLLDSIQLFTTDELYAKFNTEKNKYTLDQIKKNNPHVLYDENNSTYLVYYSSFIDKFLIVYYKNQSLFANDTYVPFSIIDGYYTTVFSENDLANFTSADKDIATLISHHGLIVDFEKAKVVPANYKITKVIKPPTDDPMSPDPDLKKIKDYLELVRNQPNRKYDLDLTNATIDDISDVGLREVHGNFIMEDSNISILPDELTVWGHFDASYCNLSVLPKKLYAKKSISFVNSSLNEFPQEIESEVIELGRSDLVSIPTSTTLVAQILDCSDCKELLYINPTISVSVNLDLRNTPIGRKFKNWSKEKLKAHFNNVTGEIEV